MQTSARTTRGSFRIVEFTNPSGVTAYRVAGWTNDGTRVRENFKTHGEAVARKAELEIQSANLEASARPVVTRLTADQVAEAERAFSELGGRPLSQAVRFFLENYREPVTSKELSEAYREFLDDRRKANLRPLSITNLRIKVNFLVRAHAGKKVHEILPQHVKEVVYTKERSARAANNVRRAISGFFSWAVDQGFCKENPVAKVKPAEEDEVDPQVLQVAEVRKLLDTAAAFKDGRLLPYFALGIFCGIRPDEIKDLNWDLIDLEQHIVTLPSSIAKMRAKRTVEILPNCVQWLLPHAAKRTELDPANWRRDFDKIRELCGYGTPTEKRPNLKPWVQDYMRHTAISHFYAKFKDEGRAASWAGNSPDIVHRHYKGLVTPKDSDAFWAILPSDSSAKIVNLSKAT